MRAGKVPVGVCYARAQGVEMRRSAHTCSCLNPNECECAALVDDRPGFLIVWLVGALLVGLSLMALLVWLLFA